MLTSLLLGDSLTSAKASKAMILVVRDLQKVFSAVFKIVFTDAGNTLAHGVQEDSSSCGVCTVNAIEHAVFGAKLFTH